jgi:hypothetical protein
MQGNCSLVKLRWRAKKSQKLLTRLALCMTFITLPVSAEENFGSFEGKVAVEWTGPRDMILTEDFIYIDAHLKKWIVPKGHKVNGASIPRLFWTLVGSPYTGEYRYASVVHDYFCDVKTEPWNDVHRVFYYASRAAGTSERQAKLMYFAIYAKGPRWGADVSNCASVCHSEVAPSTRGEPPTVVERLEEARTGEDVAGWIERENPSLEEIESVAETFTHVGVTAGPFKTPHK